MKKFLILFAFVALTISGCKKDDDKKTYNGDFSINGKSYTVSNMTWFDVTLELGGTSNTSYAVSGTDEEEVNSLTLNVSKLSAGSITIDEKNYLQLEVGDVTYTAKSGSITISSFNNDEVIGTFDCKFVAFGSTTEIAGTGKFDANKLSF